ncbi:aminoglycoside phosphotransferase family protein [Chloroflexi bacterium TSY]|nr:aminoglycoside phosphotransferase family protein [Chloroflexi bacterium TSY]
MGKTVAHLQHIDRGYTPARRLVVTFTDESSLFAKVATTELTREWLHAEHRIYESLSGSFMPNFLGWDDDGVAPMLLLEDLSHAYWPPPWTEQQIQSVIAALETIWTTSIPDLPKLEDYTSVLDGWPRVADEPAPFLSLGIASENWLEKALPVLLELKGEDVARGDATLHLDVRSDNICLIGDRAILIDWNNPCIGNAQFDLGAWLPSLHAERGPLPETILPNAGDIAGILSGYFAAQAGRPPPPGAPHVRRIQLEQLKTALPWAIRELELPPISESTW